MEPTCKDCENFLGGGDWGLCCKNPPKEAISWCGFLCYEDTPICSNFKPIIKLTSNQFIDTFCNNCGSQRCGGIGTEWFNGCRYKYYLQNEDNKNETN